MKLIDAESIPWEVDGVGEIPVITKQEIDEMPKVDAIPIEWIQKKIQIIEETGDFYSSAVLVEMIEGWRTKNDTAD